MEIKYQVLAFRQQKNSPIQVAFVARAEEVMQWAGVPRKSDELLTGYQRFKDDTRIAQEIVPFFQDQDNCSPTAIIVALREDSGLGRCHLEHTGTIPVGEPILTTLTIALDEERLESDDVFAAALKYVDERLGVHVTDPTIEDTAVEGATVGEEDAQQEEDEDEEDEDDDDDSEDVNEDGSTNGDGAEAVTHLGSVTLLRMKQLLEDRENWENPGFHLAVQDYVKPGFIIDGQHRIAGAAKLGLPFMICGLYNAPWPEQVFQFTVVNLKPKRIPPSLITAIAGLSLTKDERSRVQVRLAKAGVKMDEVEIMSLVAYDEASPFHNMVDMAVAGAGKSRGSLLGYGGMKRVAKVWYAANRASHVQIMKALYATRVSVAREKWREEKMWFDFYAGFWDKVRDHYGPELWSKAADNHLFTGASLWALQDALLLQADGQMPSHWAVAGDDPEIRAHALKDRLLEVVSTSLDYLPTEMWLAPSKEWNESDTSKGRKKLSEMLKEIIDLGKKSGGASKRWRNHDWFKQAPRAQK